MIEVAADHYDLCGSLNKGRAHDAIRELIKSAASKDVISSSAEDRSQCAEPRSSKLVKLTCEGHDPAEVVNDELLESTWTSVELNQGILRLTMTYLGQST